VRTGKKFLSDTKRKSEWSRAVKPTRSTHGRTWSNHLKQLVQYLNEDWNENTDGGEKAFKITMDNFTKGPPQKPLEVDADLQLIPGPKPVLIEHLYAYISDLRSRVAQAELTKHITLERALRDAIASTFETLQRWERAAQELECAIQIEESLGEYVYAVHHLLRKGIALYNDTQFESAKDTLTRAVQVLTKKLPPGAALRYEIRVWDYLGLCYIKLKNPKKALDILLNSKHLARARTLPTPLGDASRLMRTGIAYLELGNVTKTKSSFVKSVGLRFQVGATAEAARALRYLGLVYYNTRKLEQAMSVWDLALKVQRGFSNEREQAKLYFFRGLVFHELWRQISTSSRGTADRLECALSKKLFPDDEERRLLTQIGKGFRDKIERCYRPEGHLRAAHGSYGHCAEIAVSMGLTKWANDAKKALRSLPPCPPL
jgi:tetratricopeptide (TPR) repeat protein